VQLQCRIVVCNQPVPPDKLDTACSDILNQISVCVLCVCVCVCVCVCSCMRACVRAHELHKSPQRLLFREISPVKHINLLPHDRLQERRGMYACMCMCMHQHEGIGERASERACEQERERQRDEVREGGRERARARVSERWRETVCIPTARHTKGTRAV
jgi:hypothetical protein